MKYSIIIPYYDPEYKKAQMFTNLVESIVKCSEGKDYELVIVKDGPSYVESHNRGLKAAKGDYIVVVNDDILVLDKEWLEKLTVEGGIASWSPDNQPMKMPCAWCFAMDRATFDKLGLMDERYKNGFNYEDTDYFITARELGIPFYEKEIAIKHHGEQSKRSYWGDEEHDRMVRTNRALFQEKWGDKGVI